MVEESKWLKPIQVARLLGVHVNTVKRIPDLPFFRISSRGDRRYEREAVEAWIERHTTQVG